MSAAKRGMVIALATSVAVLMHWIRSVQQEFHVYATGGLDIALLYNMFSTAGTGEERTIWG